MMYLTVCLCIALSGSLSSGEDKVPACLDMTEAQLAQLDKYTIKEDSHSKIAGEYVDFYGAKVMVDSDPEACVSSKKVFVNDNEIASEAHLKGEWFGGSHNLSGKMVKVENGIYLFKKGDSEVAKVKLYLIYCGENVMAFFTCMLQPHSEEKKKYPNAFPVITVRKDALMTPLKEADQEAVDAAKKIFEGDKELFGEIAQINNKSCL